MRHCGEKPRNRARLFLTTRPRGFVSLAWTFVVAASCGESERVAADPIRAGHVETADWESAPPSSSIVETISHLISAAPKRSRSVAALMFDVGGGPPDATAMMNLFNGATASVTGMYRESSYGMQDLVIDVLGPYTLPVAACLTLACCGPSSDRTGNGAMVAQIIASLGKTYDHYLWVYGPSAGVTNCSGGTWGDAGNPNVTKTMYCSLAITRLGPDSQELGHNLGMEHEHTLTCGATAWADDPSTCTTNEYGSNLSFMGTGSGHPSAFHKVHQGWLQGCNVIRTGGAGRFTLLPLERPCDGTQLLQVAMPKTRNAPRETVGFYYLELRTPFGYDASVARQPLVAIYAGPEFSASTGYADHTFLVQRLTTAGSSFVDPAGGLTITLEAIDTMSATINVTGPAAGSPTCLGGAAFTAPGPGPTSCVGGVGGAAGGGTGGAAGRAGTGGAGAGGAGGAGGRVVVTGAGGAVVGTGGGLGTGGAAVATGGATGVGGRAGSGGGTTGGQTGGGAPGATAGVSGGCACDVTGTNSSTTPVLLGFLVVAWARRKRMRRQR